MNTASTTPRLGKFSCGRSVTSAIDRFSTPLSPRTPSLPGARPRSRRSRCGGRKSKFLAVIGNTVVGLAGLALSSAKVAKARIQAPERVAVDQQMIDILVQKRGPSGGRGRATYAQAETSGDPSDPKLGPIVKNNAKGHAERNAGPAKTTAVDQIPCPACSARAMIKGPPGARIIVPDAESLRPGGKPITPKTAATNAA
jgi:hypothetical protein